VFFGESLLTMFGTGGSTVLNVVAALLARATENATVLGGVSFVVVLVAWLVVSAQGALIRAAANPGTETLGPHFWAGSKSFWPMLGILVFTRLGAFFVLGVVGMPLAALFLYFMDPLKSLALISFVLGIPLLMVASLISKYAIAYHMLEHRTLGVSIARSLSLFFDHWLVSIELVVTLFVVNIVVGGAAILSILLLAAPFLMLANTFAAGVWNSAFLAFGQVLGFLLLVVMGSILATFQYASWAELFLRISRERHTSKIVRVIMGWHAKYR